MKTDLEIKIKISKEVDDNNIDKINSLLLKFENLKKETTNISSYDLFLISFSLLDKLMQGNRGIPSDYRKIIEEFLKKVYEIGDIKFNAREEHMGYIQ